MQLCYWRSDHGNFGDDMNSFLWDHFIPGCRDWSDDLLLLGIGTILWDGTPKARHRLVMGSGAGYGRLPSDLNGDIWRMIAVRGPLTAEAIGCAPEVAVTDPAALLPLMPEFQGLPKSGVAFVPHWKTAATGSWAQSCALAGFEYIDPREEAKSVIRRIASAEFVISESLHGVIVADAFRTPWVAAVSSQDTPLKWYDWASSLELTYEPLYLGNTSSAAHIVRDRFKGATPRLRRYDPSAPARELAVLLDRSRRPPQPTRDKTLKGRITATARTLADRLLVPLADRQATAEQGAEILTLARRLAPTLSDPIVLAARQATFLARFEATAKEFGPKAR